MKLRRHSLSLALAALVAGSLFAPQGAAAADKRKVCVFDPSGAMGDAFNFMKGFRAAAVGFGAELELIPYTDEKTAVEDLKAGKCDGALITGVRARAFNGFTATIEAMGGVRSYGELKKVVALTASPKLASKMKKGGYEIGGVFPAGAVYLHTRDRSLKGVSDLAGKRISTLDYDKAAIAMVGRAGAAMVPADVGTFAGMFNNGGVDICYAPATAYAPLELGKGVGTKGGIMRFALAQLTLQLVLRGEAGWPEGFGGKARTWAAQNFGKVSAIATRAEKQIPAKQWVEPSAAQVDEYDQLFQSVRISLRGEGIYDKTMLSLLRRIRCKTDAARAECAEKKE